MENKKMICKICGKEFETAHPSKLYCSRRCLDEFWKYENKRQRKRKGKCAYCGKEFERLQNEAYCSTEHRLLDFSRKIQLKKCETCVYSYRATPDFIFCDYINKVGHSRPCGVNPCTVYKKASDSASERRQTFRW